MEQTTRQDIIDFLMTYYNMSLTEAIEALKQMDEDDFVEMMKTMRIW